MIHLNNKKYRGYLYNTERKRIKRNWIFGIFTVLIFIIIALIYAEIIPPEPLFSNNLSKLEPVSLVKSSKETFSAFLTSKII